jgi:hypothetical protein
VAAQHTLSIALEEIAALFLLRLWFLLDSLSTRSSYSLASIHRRGRGREWEAPVGLIVVVIVIVVIVHVVGPRTGVTMTRRGTHGSSRGSGSGSGSGRGSLGPFPAAGRWRCGGIHRLAFAGTPAADVVWLCTAIGLVLLLLLLLLLLVVEVVGGMVGVLLLVVLVGQHRGGDLQGANGILLGEQVQGRSRRIVRIAVLLVPIGPIRPTVRFVAQVIVLGSHVGLGIERYGSGADAKGGIEYTIECIKGVWRDGSIGERLTCRSCVHDGEEGSGVGGRRGERPTACDKWGETRSRDVWSEASPDKRAVEGAKAQRSLIGRTGEHSRG